VYVRPLYGRIDLRMYMPLGITEANCNDNVTQFSHYFAPEQKINHPSRKSG
jgi:hypothetical protein